MKAHIARFTYGFQWDILHITAKNDSQNVKQKHLQKVCTGIHISPLYKGMWLLAPQNLENMIFRWPVLRNTKA